MRSRLNKIISIFAFSTKLTEAFQFQSPIVSRSVKILSRAREGILLHASLEEAQQQQQEEQNNTQIDKDTPGGEISNQESLLLSLGLIDAVESAEDKQKRALKRLEATKLKEKEKLTSVVVAISSALIALLNYIYQYLHPISSIELLFSMQRSSASLSTIGQNHKPTVVDFWAPWCENCKVSAATLNKIETEYKDKINFILINGDDPDALDLIDAFGVDAIPHLALINEDGYVETALIGTVNQKVLREDLNVLISNSKLKDNNANANGETKVDLPYKMFNAFYSRPNDRTVKF